MSATLDYAMLLGAYAAAPDHAGWPRQRLLHGALRTAIRDGTLAAGSRLVATRALAQELGIARNTVLYAYEQLASEGYVISHRGGTVVAAIAGARPARPAATAAGLARRAQGLRTLPAISGATIPFIAGVPDLAAFPLAAWRRRLERAWRGLDAAQLNYGDATGMPALRHAIAAHLRAARGVLCEADQVFITDGTQASLDLCAFACADAGDTVWIENPAYGGALAAFRGAGLVIEAIAVDGDGMAPAARDWQARPPKLIYTTPSHQYPLGEVLSLARRMALIDGARAAGALIVEDDYDSEFRHEGPPLAAMQGLAADAPVLYCGTFSKTMFPGLRIGFLVAPRALAPQLAALRAQCAPAGRAAEQLALAAFLDSGEFALHLRRMRRLYRQRRDALVGALERHLGGIADVRGASAGMHLALHLRDARLSDTAIAAQAAHQGIFVTALSTLALDGAIELNGLVLGYAQVPAEQIEALVKQLAALVWLAAYQQRDGPPGEGRTRAVSRRARRPASA